MDNLSQEFNQLVEEFNTNLELIKLNPLLNITTLREIIDKLDVFDVDKLSETQLKTYDEVLYRFIEIHHIIRIHLSEEKIKNLNEYKKLQDKALDLLNETTVPFLKEKVKDVLDSIYNSTKDIDGDIEILKKTISEETLILLDLKSNR